MFSSRTRESRSVKIEKFLIINFVALFKHSRPDNIYIAAIA